MRFNGKFIAGQFVPDKEVSDRYRHLVKKCEDAHMTVSIEIKQKQRQSDSQLGLFFATCNLVAEQTGSTQEAVIHLIRKFIPKDDLGEEMKLNNLNTNQLSQFLAKSVAYLNEEFNLGIHFKVDTNGRTTVLC